MTPTIQDMFIVLRLLPAQGQSLCRPRPPERRNPHDTGRIHPSRLLLRLGEEFDHPEIDSDKWDFRRDSKLQSTQDPNNVTIQDGKLHLHVAKEERVGRSYTRQGYKDLKTSYVGAELLANKLWLWLL